MPCICCNHNRQTQVVPVAKDQDFSFRGLKTSPRIDQSASYHELHMVVSCFGGQKNRKYGEELALCAI